MRSAKKGNLVIGWREWVRLPELGIRLIKAKADTGARTSALHAENLRFLRRGGQAMVRFTVHPMQRSKRSAVEAVAVLVEERSVRSSSGDVDLRPVIRTELDIGGEVWPIELTLTCRDLMGFRMLLGRQAIRAHALVDPARSFVTRKVKRRNASRQ